MHSSLPALRHRLRGAGLRGRGGRGGLREERHGGVAGHGEALHTLGLGPGGDGTMEKW